MLRWRCYDIRVVKGAISIGLVIGLLNLCFPLTSAFNTQYQVSNIEALEFPEKVEVRITATGPARYSVLELTNPIRLVLDVHDAGLTWEQNRLVVNKGGLGEIWASQHSIKPDKVRIAMGLSQVVKYKVSSEENQILVNILKEELAPLSKREEEALKIEALEKAKSIGLHYGRAEAYYKLGEISKAILEWQTILDLDPGQDKARELLKQAKEELDKARIREKNKELSYSNALQKKTQDEAKLKKEMAEKAKLEAIALHQSRADSYYKAGEYSRAIAEWQAVLALKPTEEQALEGIRSAALKLEEEAKLKREAAEKAKLDTIALHYKQADEYYRRGEYSQAIAEWQAILSLDLGQTKAQEAIKTATLKPALISMDFKDADLANVLRILSQENNLNIIAGDVVKGKVTVSFVKVTIDEALSSILRVNGYDYIRDGNIIRITGSGEAKVETVSQTYTFKYINLKEIKNVREEMMRLVSKDGQVFIDERSNSVMVMDTPANVRKIMDFYAKIDVPIPQVMIEAKIMEVVLDKEHSFGIDWSWLNSSGHGARVSMPLPAIATSISLYGKIGEGELTAALQALQGKAKVNLLSSPKILTVINQQAKILVGEKFPVKTKEEVDATGKITKTFEFKDIGIQLLVTPFINVNNTITMKIHPEISNIGGWVEEMPIVGTREADTQVTVMNGETVVIGGLIKDNKDERVKMVPVLGKVPVLNHLFKSKRVTESKTETLVFLTPRILSGEKELK